MNTFFMRHGIECVNKYLKINELNKWHAAWQQMGKPPFLLHENGQSHY